MSIRHVTDHDVNHRTGSTIHTVLSSLNTECVTDWKILQLLIIEDGTFKRVQLVDILRLQYIHTI